MILEGFEKRRIKALGVLGYRLEPPGYVHSQATPEQRRHQCEERGT